MAVDPVERPGPSGPPPDASPHEAQAAPRSLEEILSDIAAATQELHRLRTDQARASWVQRGAYRSRIAALEDRLDKLFAEKRARLAELKRQPGEAAAAAHRGLSARAALLASVLLDPEHPD
jgi:hypothetical protein